MVLSEFGAVPKIESLLITVDASDLTQVFAS